mgnify:CR=1 FL=1
MRHIRQMTQPAPKSLIPRDKLIVSAILAGVALITLVDVASDWDSGTSLSHIAIELTLAAFAAAGVAWLWTDVVRQRSRAQETRLSLEGARAEAALWRQRHAQALRGLSAAIDQQLEAWSLTPAEKEVALLLLKGLSFKEIADVRGASERTVRQQARGIYAKSGLAGRAELAAFFLEDLLV